MLYECHISCKWGGNETSIIILQPETSIISTQRDPSVATGFELILGTLKMVIPGNLEHWITRLCITTPLILLFLLLGDILEAS